MNRKMFFAQNIMKEPTCSLWEINSECWTNIKTKTVSDIVTQFRFKPDGTKFYTTEGHFKTTIKEYSLSTAWDISTASYTQTHDFGGSDYVAGFDFNDNGTLIFIIRWKYDGTNQYSNVYKHSLSSAWDVSTISSSSSQSKRLEGDYAQDLRISSDGTRLYSIVNNDLKIYQHNLSTGFDLSTLSYANKSIDNPTGGRGIYLKPDGYKIYSAEIVQYDLSNSYELDSASIAASEGYESNYVVEFKSDGSMFFVAGLNDSTIYQYELL